MRTDSVNYDTFYSKARSLFFDNYKAYKLDRKTEAVAYLVALETGLRVSDMLGLKYSDITYNDSINSYVFEAYVNKVSTDHIGQISNELFAILETFKNEIRTEGNSINDSIFYNYKTGKPYSRQWLHKRIKVVSEKIGLENISVHSLRRASAIKVLDKTGSLSMAQYHLTHKRTSTTDKYLNVSKNSALKQIAKALG